MSTSPWLRRIFWIDGLAALSAGVFVLVLRRPLAELYALPLDLVTTIGLVNLAYSTFGLTLATRRRRPLAFIVALALANVTWASICLVLAMRFRNEAGTLGLAHILFEGAFVAALATIEWRNRRALTENS